MTKIKQAAAQYFYSISDRLIEDWGSEELLAHLKKHPKDWTVWMSHEVYECMLVADIIFEVLHLEKVMSEQETITANIPFSGFYHSNISYYLEQESEEPDVVEPEHWQVVHANVAKRYTEEWADITGFPVTFSRLVSPQFYNFETDKIEVLVPVEFVKNLRTVLLVLEEFGDFVSETCSSRDGFHSFMSSSIHEWPIVWDHREVAVAFMFLEQKIEDLDGSIEDRIIEDMSCNGGFQW